MRRQRTSESKHKGLNGISPIEARRPKIGGPINDTLCVGRNPWPNIPTITRAGSVALARRQSEKKKSRRKKKTNSSVRSREQSPDRYLHVPISSQAGLPPAMSQAASSSPILLLWTVAKTLFLFPAFVSCCWFFWGCVRCRNSTSGSFSTVQLQMEQTTGRVSPKGKGGIGEGNLGSLLSFWAILGLAAYTQRAFRAFPPFCRSCFSREGRYNAVEVNEDKTRTKAKTAIKATLSFPKEPRSL